jgi:hypothetical protein
MNNQQRLELIRQKEQLIREAKSLISEQEDAVRVLKAEIVGEMRECGVLSEEFGDFIISRRKGSLSVSVQSPDKLPHNLRTENITYTPNKKAIKEILQAGSKVDGASLVRGDETLVVRRK